MRNTRNYDWLGLIRFNKATEDFLKYQRKHKNISVNRAARSFCLKKKYNLWSIFNADFCKAIEEGLCE